MSNQTTEAQIKELYESFGWKTKWYPRLGVFVRAALNKFGDETKDRSAWGDSKPSDWVPQTSERQSVPLDLWWYGNLNGVIGAGPLQKPGPVDDARDAQAIIDQAYEAAANLVDICADWHRERNLSLSPVGIGILAAKIRNLIGKPTGSQE
jgi:hypothetical protein